MAGKAIKMNSLLGEMIPAFHVMKATGIDKYRFIGVMHRLWCEADNQSRDGTIAGHPNDIDRIVDVSGIADALFRVGWISTEGDRIKFEKQDPGWFGRAHLLWKSIPRHQRKAIPADIREQIAPPGVACVACGSTEDIQVDHILAVAKGGSDHIDNLQPLCKPCNVSKGTKSMDEFMAGRVTA